MTHPGICNFRSDPLRVTLVNLWAQGGMAHYTSQLANHLRVSGCRVSVIAAPGFDSSLLTNGIDVQFVDVPTVLAIGALTRLPVQLLKLPRFISAIDLTKPDICHVICRHPWLTLTLPLLVRRYPVCSTFHEIVPHRGENSWWRRLDIYILVRYSSGAFVHSEELRQALSQEPWRFPALSIAVIPHGDYAFFREWTRCEIPEEPCTVLFFGRILPYKGLGYLLEAMSQVVRQVPEVRLIVAGEGDVSPYRHLIETADYPIELYNHFVPDREAPRLFQRAALFALPYVEASQSGVIPIAYAFRKPVVATQVGSLPKMVEHEVTGLLVPPRDSHGLAEAIVRLLSGKALRDRMGEAAYQKMKRDFSWNTVVRSTIALYRQVLKWHESATRSVGNNRR